YLIFSTLDPSDHVIDNFIHSKTNPHSHPTIPNHIHPNNNPPIPPLNPPYILHKPPTPRPRIPLLPQPSHEFYPLDSRNGPSLTKCLTKSRSSNGRRSGGGDSVSPAGE